MVPSFYSFVHKSKVFYGALALEQIPGELGRIPATRPLVITDKKTEERIIKALAGAFARMPDPLTVFDDAPLLVDETGINEIAAIYREAGCNSILAVGGSRVFDIARGVAAALTLDGEGLASLAGEEKVEGPLPPLYAIPTTVHTRSALGMDLELTAGSGRCRIVSPLLMPRGVFIDKRAMSLVQARDVARGLLASLFRAFEAATGPQRNPVALAFSATSLKMVAENGVKAVKANSRKARACAVCAGVISEIAVSNTTRGLGVALAGAVGRSCGAPRDLAGGVMLPSLVKLRIKSAPGSMERLLLAVAGPERFSKTPPVDRAAAAAEAIADLARAIAQAGGFPLSLTSLGMPSGFDEIAGRVAEDSEALGGEKVLYEQVASVLNLSA